MEITTPQSCSEYFDALVAQMRERDAFAYYTKPRGKPLKHVAAGVDAASLKCPYLNGRQAVAGVALFPGDSSYEPLTTRNFSFGRQFLPDGMEMWVKTSTLADGINHYMTPVAFETYLKYFREHLGLPSHKAALAASLYQMHNQICNPDWVNNPQNSPPRFSAEAIEKTIQALLKQRPSEINSAEISDQLVQSEYVERAYQHPDLVLAVAIYHAAHKAYLSQLEAAIARSPMGDDERHNAHYVLGKSGAAFVKQFEEFFIFGTYMPLAIRELEMNPKANANELLIDGGISRAWDMFFKLKLLTRTYPIGTLAPEERAKILAARARENAGESVPAGETKDVTITCPALAHLKDAQKSGLLEQNLTFINKNHDVLRHYLEAAKNTAQDAAAEARGELGFVVNP